MASKKSTPKFDPKLYAKRVSALYDDWKNPESQDLWKNIGALVVTNGTPDEEIIYKKSTALQDWLFGFELENTVMVFTEREVHILSTKADLLAGIADARPADRPELSTTLHTAEVGQDNTQHFDKLLSVIRDNLEGKGVGALPREAALGDYIDSWKKAFDGAGFTVVNAANAISNLFALKDEQEQKFVRTASAISAAVLKNSVVPEIETVVDEEKKVTHSAMAGKIDDIFLTPSRINPKLTADLVESCYTPIIQSGGVYDLKPSAVSNDDQLHFGTIICSLGARYRHYCSNVARTYFVDPDKDQEEIYALLLEVHKLMIKALVPGNPVKKIMEVALEHIQKKKPELLPHFVKTGGFGMGLEFRESALSISNKNTKAIKEGMVFNISPGFHNLERKGDVADPRKKVYSMMIADTVVVPASGEAKPLTANAPSAWDDISYSVGDDEDEAEEEEVKKPAAKSKGKEKKDAGRTSSRLRDDAAAFGMRTTRARDADKNKKDMAAELRRKKHQEELEKKKREEAEARFSSKSKGDSGREVVVKEVMAYRSATEFPPEARNGRIHIDQKRETVLLPIYGMLVPFHISTIKNATKSEDYLRINFVTPGSTVPNDKLPKVWKDGQATFIREMSFRCSDIKSLGSSLRLINELRKRASLRAHDSHVRDSLVAQEELVLSKVRPISLPDLYIRPTLGGRRSTGTLELHKNGFRFRSSKGGHIDILFKNIKHAFFQPAENEVITIIHFHLWHPIMVGKKKTSDIQAYSEVMEIAQALDGRMPRGMEREDYDDENHEREQRAKMNADFQNFTKKVEDLVPDLEFDIPYRELGFFGVPGRTSTFLMPTVHCLVQLVEPPFFVLTLDEVDIAHFERVQFSLKNFDLVFVYKDLTRQPAFISAIPVQNLEPIKDWLDECNIKYYEGPANLNWKTILSTIREDPKKFWEDGGWNFLNTDGGSDDDASESEEEDAYNPSDQSDDEAAESESDAYSGSAEEDDDVSDDDAEEDDDAEDSEEEGLDWDELEKRAAEEDKRVKYDDDVPKSRKRGRDDYSDEDDEDDRPKRSAAPAKRGAGGARPSASGGARPAAGRSSASSSSSARPSSGARARPSASSSSSGARAAAGASGGARRAAAPSDPKRRRLDH